MIISLQQIKEMKLTHLDRGVEEDAWNEAREETQQSTIWQLFRRISMIYSFKFLCSTLFCVSIEIKLCQNV